MTGKHNEINIKKLKSVLITATSVIDDFSMYMIQGGRKLEFPQAVFSKLLNRTRINMEAITYLLVPYLNEPYTFHPISHILRALLVDYLNFLYLLTFLKDDEKEYSSFANEYEFFNKDYYNSLIEIFEIEDAMPKECPLYEKINRKSEERIFQKTQIRERYKHLHSENDQNNKKLKTAREMMRTSDHSLFSDKTDIDEPKRGVLSERHKYKRILKSDLKQYVDVYMYYKYVSQQFHFSHHSNDLVSIELKDSNFLHLIWICNRVFHLVQTQVAVIDGWQSDYLKKLIAIEQELSECV